MHQSRSQCMCNLVHMGVPVQPAQYRRDACHTAAAAPGGSGSRRGCRTQCPCLWHRTAGAGERSSAWRGWRHAAHPATPILPPVPPASQLLAPVYRPPGNAETRLFCRCHFGGANLRVRAGYLIDIGQLKRFTRNCSWPCNKEFRNRLQLQKSSLSQAGCHHAGCGAQDTTKPHQWIQPGGVDEG